MEQYHQLCRHILNNGNQRGDRTGTGTLSVFGYQMRFDLQKGFPLLTTKDMSGPLLNGIIQELLWFLRGSTDVKELMDVGVNIWNRDAYRAYKEGFARYGIETVIPYQQFVKQVKSNKEFAELHGDLGPIYGQQWRSWDSMAVESFDGEFVRTKKIDQIAEVIESIKNSPESRRHVVSAWNVGDLPHMTLPPCHVLFQFYVRDGKYLDCQLYQRSADVFLGLPFNIASYALLTMIVAQICGLEPGEFVHVLGDAHIYNNHIDQVKLQLSRPYLQLPTMTLNPDLVDIDAISQEDMTLHDYDSHPAIKGEMST